MDTSIEFDGVLSPSCMKHLISTFVKYVLYQRGQIPFHFDSLKAYAQMPAEKMAPDVISSDLEDMDCHDANDIRQHRQQLRESLRQARSARRKLKTDEKLRRRTRTFLDSYIACDQHLSSTLDSRSWPSGVQVALLLGSSPVSPKEVYVLHFPGTDSGFDRHPQCLQHRRGAVQLFRTLVTSSQLLELTARQLAPTNLHVLVHTVPGGSGQPALVPRPEQAFRRGTVIHIRLQHGASALAVPLPPPPPPPPAVSQCCGRAPPRRLQACCARYAAEMGLALLDASLSPLPAARESAGEASPQTTTSSAHLSSQASALDAPPPTSGSSQAASEPAVRERCGTSPVAGSDEQPEPAPAAMWCQIPVTLRGFRAPAVRRASGDWLATTE